jgi:hypothetical protein
LAVAIIGLLTTCRAHAQVGYLVAQPGGMYTTTVGAGYMHPVAIQAYAIPAAAQGYALVSYGHAQPSYSMTPVSYATVSYPQVSYAAPSAWYAASAAPQVAGQLVVVPAGQASGLVYFPIW